MKINWKRNTILFLASQTTSMFGTMLVQYAIMWHIVLKTGSGAMMTLYVVAGVLPTFFTSLFGGVWADRYNKKHLINIADGSIAFVSLLIAITLFAGYDSIPLLLVAAAVRALGQGVQGPAVNSLIPLIVPQEHLLRVNGINASIQSGIFLLSPAASAALMTFAPLYAIFFIDVITASIAIYILYFLVKVPVTSENSNATVDTVKNNNIISSTVSAQSSDEMLKNIQQDSNDSDTVGADLRVSPDTDSPDTMNDNTKGEHIGSPLQSNNTPEPKPDQPSQCADLINGLKYIKREKYLFILAIIALFFMITMAPVGIMAPLQVTRNFGEDIWRLSVIEIGFAAGMMLGGLLVGIYYLRNRIYMMGAATVVFGIITALLGIWETFIPYVVCMVIGGITSPYFSAPYLTLLQERVNPAYMGRVMSVFTMIVSIGMPLGMLIFGPLSDVIDINYIFIGTGIMIIIIGLILFVSRTLRAAGEPMKE